MGRRACTSGTPVVDRLLLFHSFAGSLLFSLRVRASIPDSLTRRCVGTLESPTSYGNNRLCLRAVGARKLVEILIKGAIPRRSLQPTDKYESRTPASAPSRERALASLVRMPACLALAFLPPFLSVPFFFISVPFFFIVFWIFCLVFLLHSSPLVLPLALASRSELSSTKTDKKPAADGSPRLCSLS